VAVTQFNNNLGTFIEYKAQVETKNRVLKFHILHDYQALEKNFKTLQEFCQKNICPATFNKMVPDFTEYRNTIQKLDTVDLK